MGFRSNLKKSVRSIVKGGVSPYNFVVPFVGGLGVTMKSEHDEHKEENKELEAEAATIAAENAEFNENLEKKRKSGAKSGVIYAGILGDNKNIGLGGKKSLLGL